MSVPAFLVRSVLLILSKVTIKSQRPLQSAQHTTPSILTLLIQIRKNWDGQTTIAVVFTEQTEAIVELHYEKNRMTILGK